jgi:apolipoprotein D and lipocalin family protein
MRKNFMASFVLCLCMLASPAFQSISISNSSGAVSAADALPPVQVVDFVDVARYLGLWYEIAKIPNSFQSFCSGGTTAEYTLRNDGSVGVLNICRGRLGFPRQAIGRAFVDDPVTNAKLKVSFVCFFNRCFFFGDYWIIGLGPNYEYAVIGHPTRKYGWILSRECKLSDAAMAEVKQILESQYYNFADFVMTDQSVNGCQ